MDLDIPLPKTASSYGHRNYRRQLTQEDQESNNAIEDILSNLKEFYLDQLHTFFGFNYSIGVYKIKIIAIKPGPISVGFFEFDHSEGKKYGIFSNLVVIRNHQLIPSSSLANKDLNTLFSKLGPDSSIYSLVDDFGPYYFRGMSGEKHVIGYQSAGVWINDHGTFVPSIYNFAKVKNVIPQPLDDIFKDNEVRYKLLQSDSTEDQPKFSFLEMSFIQQWGHDFGFFKRFGSNDAGIFLFDNVFLNGEKVDPKTLTTLEARMKLFGDKPTEKGTNNRIITFQGNIKRIRPARIQSKQFILLRLVAQSVWVWDSKDPSYNAFLKSKIDLTKVGANDKMLYERFLKMKLEDLFLADDESGVALSSTNPEFLNFFMSQFHEFKNSTEKKNVIKVELTGRRVYAKNLGLFRFMDQENIQYGLFPYTVVYLDDKKVDLSAMPYNKMTTFFKEQISKKRTVYAAIGKYGPASVQTDDLKLTVVKWLTSVIWISEKGTSPPDSVLQGTLNNTQKNAKKWKQTTSDGSSVSTNPTTGETSVKNTMDANKEDSFVDVFWFGYTNLKKLNPILKQQVIVEYFDSKTNANDNFDSNNQFGIFRYEESGIDVFGVFDKNSVFQDDVPVDPEMLNGPLMKQFFKGVGPNKRIVAQIGGFGPVTTTSNHCPLICISKMADRIKIVDINPNDGLHFDLTTNVVNVFKTFAILEEHLTRQNVLLHESKLSELDLNNRSLKEVLKVGQRVFCDVMQKPKRLRMSSVCNAEHGMVKRCDFLATSAWIISKPKTTKVMFPCADSDSDEDDPELFGMTDQLIKKVIGLDMEDSNFGDVITNESELELAINLSNLLVNAIKDYSEITDTGNDKCIEVNDPIRSDPDNDDSRSRSNESDKELKLINRSKSADADKTKKSRKRSRSTERKKSRRSSSKDPDVKDLRSRLTRKRSISNDSEKARQTRNRSRSNERKKSKRSPSKDPDVKDLRFRLTRKRSKSNDSEKGQQTINQSISHDSEKARQTRNRSRSNERKKSRRSPSKDPDVKDLRSRLTRKRSKSNDSEKGRRARNRSRSNDSDKTRNHRRRSRSNETDKAKRSRKRSKSNDSDTPRRSRKRSKSNDSDTARRSRKRSKSNDSDTARRSRKRSKSNDSDTARRSRKRSRSNEREASHRNRSQERDHVRRRNRSGSRNSDSGKQKSNPQVIVKRKSRFEPEPEPGPSSSTIPKLVDYPKSRWDDSPEPEPGEQVGPVTESDIYFHLRQPKNDKVSEKDIYLHLKKPETKNPLEKVFLKLKDRLGEESLMASTTWLPLHLLPMFLGNKDAVYTHPNPMRMVKLSLSEAKRQLQINIKTPRVALTLRSRFKSKDEMISAVIGNSSNKVSHMSVKFGINVFSISDLDWIKGNHLFSLQLNDQVTLDPRPMGISLDRRPVVSATNVNPSEEKIKADDAKCQAIMKAWSCSSCFLINFAAVRVVNRDEMKWEEILSVIKKNLEDII